MGLYIHSTVAKHYGVVTAVPSTRVYSVKLYGVHSRLVLFKLPRNIGVLL